MKTTLELATDIVTSNIKARASSLSCDEIAKALITVCQTLTELSQDAAPEAHEMVRSPTDSIRRHEIICLECGETFKLLSNSHLARHGLTPSAYKRKYGFRRRQPLSSELLTQRRRRVSKSKQTGQRLAKWHAARHLSSETSTDTAS